jgi:hypothetical protein
MKQSIYDLSDEPEHQAFGNEYRTINTVVEIKHD